MNRMDRPDIPIDLASSPDFELGQVQVRPSTREIEGQGWKDVLEPRVMQVFVALAQAGGAVVSRDNLVQRCWDGRIVGEDALTRCIAKIRSLSDTDRRRSFIVETVPRVGYRLSTAVPAEEQKQCISICVLPFANMSGDPEQEYFSDGVTADIITDLSKVSALSVVSRNTAFTFKGKPIDVAQVARQLKVSHIVEGSIRKFGNSVRITAQLIDGASDTHVWAERYDRDLKDIFALQDEISQAIVSALKLKLLASEKETIGARSTTQPEAYKLYLMARHYSLLGNPRHREIIVRLCRRALEIDPNYARAWALLAVSEANMLLNGDKPEGNAWDAAQRALSLDPNLAEAHAARGRVLADTEAYGEALAEHEIALSLDPDSYEVNVAAGRCFIHMRRFEDAIRCLEKAATVAPTEFSASGMIIQCYRTIGDSKAEQQAARRSLARVEKVIELQPEHGTAMSFGVLALTSLGETERAKEWAERAVLLDPDNTNLLYNLACSRVYAGACDDALDLLEEYIRRAPLQCLGCMKADSDLDPLRDLPRFHAIVNAAADRLSKVTRAETAQS